MCIVTISCTDIMTPASKELTLFIVVKHFVMARVNGNAKSTWIKLGYLTGRISYSHSEDPLSSRCAPFNIIGQIQTVSSFIINFPHAWKDAYLMERFRNSTVYKATVCHNDVLVISIRHP